MDISNEIDDFSSLFDVCSDKEIEDICSDVCSESPSPVPIEFSPEEHQKLIVPSIGKATPPNNLIPMKNTMKKDGTFPPPLFNAGIILPFMPQSFNFQSTSEKPVHKGRSLAQDSSVNLGGTRKRKGAKDHEERRLKNREAADRSRQKRRELLDMLPAKNAELEAKVQALECKLSASLAEATALREQCNFFKTLLSQGQFDNNSKNTFSLPSSSDVMVPHSSQGVLLLAVCCVLTVNQCGLLVETFPENEGIVNNGGRILLSTNIEEEPEGSPFRFISPEMKRNPMSLFLITLFGLFLMFCLFGSMSVRLKQACSLLGLPLWKKTFFKAHES